MMRVFQRFFFLALLGAAQSSFAADDSDLATREKIAARLPGVSAENVGRSPVPGLYEVMVGPIVVYVSADGRFLVRGEIHDLQSDKNLTQERVAAARVRTLADLDDDELIVFGEPGLEHSVTVFTDVSCGYCRELHSKIEEYNKRGIRIRYAAFPRNGLASNTWQKMEEVWCAKDRNKALTMAKLDREFTSSHCGGEHVTEQWQLGRMLGVRGTPAIFTESGQLLPGYLPPNELLKRLQSEPQK